MPARPAAGGGRWVDVDPARLSRWLAGFTERHGDPQWTYDGAGVGRLTAPDGSVAELHEPPGATGDGTLTGFVVGATTPRRIGLLLARQSACAVGIAAGPELVASKVDSSYVQSRTAAGGWSQHRFARRRENQAKAAAGDAAGIAVRLLVPELDSLSCVVTGGDRKAVEAILADPRLVRVAQARADRFLDVPEPRLNILEKSVAAARAARIRVVDPD